MLRGGRRDIARHARRSLRTTPALPPTTARITIPFLPLLADVKGYRASPGPGVFSVDVRAGAEVRQREYASIGRLLQEEISERVWRRGLSESRSTCLSVGCISRGSQAASLWKSGRGQLVKVGSPRARVPQRSNFRFQLDNASSRPPISCCRAKTSPFNPALFGQSRPRKPERVSGLKHLPLAVIPSVNRLHGLSRVSDKTRSDGPQPSGPDDSNSKHKGVSKTVNQFAYVL